MMLSPLAIVLPCISVPAANVAMLNLLMVMACFFDVYILPQNPSFRNFARNGMGMEREWEWELPSLALCLDLIKVAGLSPPSFRFYYAVQP